MKPINHKRSKPMFDKHEERQCTRNTAVPIRKRMDLYEAMMEPCRLHDRVHWATFQFLIESYEAIHFSGDVFWRGIFKKRVIRPQHVICLCLPLPMRQLSLKGSSQNVGSR